MPFDIPMQDMIPENLDFAVEFEPTRVKDKKYVINGDTGEYIGVVGDTFNCASHTEFFEGVHDTVTENLGAAQCEDMNMKWRSARQNAWAMLDMTLPNVTARIETDKHSTTIAQRLIALHGIDGSCSNQTFFGAIDFFCTNGMIRGEHDKVRRKNTANFTMDRFIRDLRTWKAHSRSTDASSLFPDGCNSKKAKGFGTPTNREEAPVLRAPAFQVRISAMNRNSVLF